MLHTCLFLMRKGRDEIFLNICHNCFTYHLAVWNRKLKTSIFVLIQIIYFLMILPGFIKILFYFCYFLHQIYIGWCTKCIYVLAGFNMALLKIILLIIYNTSPSNLTPNEERNMKNNLEYAFIAKQTLTGIQHCLIFSYTILCVTFLSFHLLIENQIN